MQLVFGALAIEADQGSGFARARAASLASWPGTPLSTALGPFAAIGCAARSFASWQDPEGRLSVYLVGRILVIDGSETRGGGGSSADLASIGRLFAVRGREAWSRLDGSFLLVVRVDSTLYVGVDVGGARGVYWYVHEGVLVFHSHLLDLAPTYPGVLAEDWGAIATYLTSGLYPPGSTALRGIHHLGAGQCVTMTSSGMAAGSHFRLGFHEPSPLSRGRLVDELVGLVTTATAARWRVARDPVVPLSGGVDSRYLAAEIARLSDPSMVRTITWGEDRERKDGDAVVAARVAARLGIENEWHAKSQRHTPETFARAIYLSSGECDAAIHYPVDHVLHERLAADEGFASLFRGDECLQSEGYLTDRGVRAAPGLTPLATAGTFASLLGPSILADMARAQGPIIDSILAGLTSRTASGRGDEAWYEIGLRRLLAPYNAVKDWDLEVFTPFLDRRILEWTRGVPDDLRMDKRILRLALARRHPELATIPYASRSNLPIWQQRSLEDPEWAAFFRDWCAAPGWLETIGAKDRVVAALDAIRATASAPRGAHRSFPRPPWRRLAAGVVPAHVLVEIAAARRARRNAMPAYLRLARLAVLHGLLGTIRERHGHWPSGGPVPDSAAPSALEA